VSKHRHWAARVSGACPEAGFQGRKGKDMEWPLLTTEEGAHQKKLKLLARAGRTVSRRWGGKVTGGSTKKERKRIKDLQLIREEAKGRASKTKKLNWGWSPC